MSNYYRGPLKREDWRKLNKEEENILLHKGTEAPFKGFFTEKKERGLYICKRCESPLFWSDCKFDSSCGWPSFDDQIDGAVKREGDADGRRTEILCSTCGGHLGHTFTGEAHTDKNLRHCVNSLSLDFIPEENIEKAVFAGGCFWGMEYHFSKLPGVYATRVGYTGGKKDNPDYRTVCMGSSGHYEAMEVSFDPLQISFEELARLFFEIHDPTQVDGQGPDKGDQYLSAIFYLSEEQKCTAEKLISILKTKGLDVVTDLIKAKHFWNGEAYHQNYYAKKEAEPYCHIYRKRF